MGKWRTLSPRSCNATGHLPRILWLLLQKKRLEVMAGRGNHLVFAEADTLPAERFWQSLQGEMHFNF